MSERPLKPGWRWVKFGEVVRQVKDRVDPKTAGLARFIAGEHMDTDDLRLRRWGDVGDGYLGPAFHMRFKPGQVLYGSRRTYLRKVAVADFEGICANTTYVLETNNPAVLLPELLPFVMQTAAFNEHSIKQSKGSVNPYINFSDLAWYEFALPPLGEQKHVLQLLVATQNATEAFYLAQHSVSRLEDAYLQDAFSANYERLDKWLRVELREIAYVQSGVAKGKMLQPGKSVEVPYLSVSNVQDGHLDLSDVKTIVVEKSRIAQYQLKSGDVLMTEGGDPDKLGRGTVWQGEIEGCVHQNHIFAVRPNTERLDPWYLAGLARSPYGKQYFLGSSKRTSNLATINKQQVGSFSIPLPSLNDQRAIAADWLSIRAAGDQVAQREAQSHLIYATILSKALAGGE